MYGSITSFLGPADPCSVVSFQNGICKNNPVAIGAPFYIIECMEGFETVYDDTDSTADTSIARVTECRGERYLLHTHLHSNGFKYSGRSISAGEIR